MTRTKPIPVALPIVLTLLVLSACGGEPESAETVGGIPVEVATAHLTPIARAYRYSGTVRGARRVELGTRMLGRITYLTAEEGDRVRRGEVLVRLHSDDIVAQRTQVEAGLVEAKAALANAETNFRRIRNLYESDSATRKELDDATVHYEMSQARVTATEARLAEVKEALDYAVLTAPFAGSVVRRMADRGDMAAPGQPLLAIEDTGQLEVVAQVPADDILLLSEGNTVDIEVGDPGEVRIGGVVTQINPSGDARTRQFDVLVSVNEGEGSRIKSGMFARVVLRKGEHSIISVPEMALQRRGQLTGLFAVDAEGRALLRWVRTGRHFGDRVEIVSGLTAGETYVLSAEGRLVDGQRVQVRPDAQVTAG